MFSLCNPIRLFLPGEKISEARAEMRSFREGGKSDIKSASGTRVAYSLKTVVQYTGNKDPSQSEKDVREQEFYSCQMNDLLNGSGLIVRPMKG